jgi:hypothetical protein
MFGLSLYAARVRSGLRVSRCKSRGSEPAASLIEQLRSIDDPARLDSSLREATDQQLTELRSQAPAGSTLSDAVQWEQAFRRRDWRALSDLARTRPRTFPSVHIARLVDILRGGRTNIQVDTSDQDFASWAYDRFWSLGAYPAGFRLIVELLASGQPIRLRGGSGGSQREPQPGAAPEAGSLVYTEGGAMLPFERQHRGSPTGTTIVYDRTEIANSVTLSGRPGALQFIDTDETMTFGHELIHALHAARGELLPNLPIATNPVTGRMEEPEDQRTITGTTSWGSTRFNVDPGISENDLRAERGLPLRVSHAGQIRAVAVRLPAGETHAQIIARYTVAGMAPSAALQGLLGRLLVDFGIPNPIPAGLDPGFAIPLPSPAYVSDYADFIARDTTLATEATNLQLRR